MIYNPHRLVAAALTSLVAGVLSDQIVLGSDALEPGEVQYQLKISGVIPTVLDDFRGTHTLEIKWPSDAEAELGNTLDPKDLQKTPNITLSWAEDDETCDDILPTQYIIAATDPDAPSRNDAKWGEFCHWIVTGLAVPEKKPHCGRLSFLALKDVLSYKPPGPPEKTGPHRYVFVAYKYNNEKGRLHLGVPGHRKHWGYDKPGYGVRDWAEENGLKPVAANFIYSQNEKQ